ncbi:MAG: hypothetical protein WC405_09010 [Syntrophales bacterium]
MLRSLKHCYDKILGKYSSLDIEAFSIVKTVHDYRQLWKPQKVDVILLAESHVYTEDKEHEILLKQDPLLPSGYPRNFVRFVYCLGYGENDLLTKEIAKNPGTWQYWKLLYSCLNDVRNNNCDFLPILKGGTRNINQRIQNKIQLLNILKAKGIWLVDSSIVAINNIKKKDREEIIKLCWKYYISDLIIQINPKHVIIIGNTVEGAIRDKLEAMPVECSCRPQPQSWEKSEVHMDSYKHYFDICNRYNNYAPNNLGKDSNILVNRLPIQEDPKELSVGNIKLIHKLSAAIISEYKWTIDLETGYYSAHIKKASECSISLRYQSNNVIESIGCYKLDLDGLLAGGFINHEHTSGRLRIIIHYHPPRYFIYRNKSSARLEIPL